MGEYDLSLRRLADQRPRDFLRLVLGRPVDRAEVLDRDLPIGELSADSLILTDGDLLVHIEFQTRWTRVLARRMLEYRVLLGRKDAKRYASVRSVVILLTPQNYPKSGSNRYQEGPVERPELTFEFDEVREVPADDLLDLKLPGLLPLVPLSRDVEPEKMAEAARPAADVADPILRTDVLGGLRYLSALSPFPEAMKPMITKRELYELSATYREDIDEARLEGAMANARADVLHILRIRFAAAPADLAGRLERVASRERLQELLELAVKCSSLAAFVEQLPA